ncbi:MAG: hypothetical protein QNJ54_15925 [Prochloraceae cyanobacterium]|nr:hypothetical protein [Prochloraceae cyanobacterium]
MADDRKKRILDHLARTSSDNQNLFGIKKKAQQVNGATPPVEPIESAQPVPVEENNSAPVEVSEPAEPINSSTPPTPEKVDSPQDRILAHLKSSSDNFSDFSRTSKQRIKQIEEHIRKTTS